MSGATDITTGDLTETADAGEPRAPGQVLGGRYLLRELIGQGGMAQVWKAEHLTLHRPVAVKFLNLKGEPSVVRARFLREARIAAAVRHRYVVDIVDFGAASDGTPFMVMELVEGRTLATRIQRGPSLSLADVVRIAARLLAGLEAVHAAGIVHGDLKPDNVVLLVESGHEDTPKLLDFGISRLSRRDTSSGMRSVVPTEDRDILGTPPYMSPEQAGGGDMDHRSDLFTVGTMLYEMLAGQRPFDDENPLRTVAAVREAAPVPLASLRPDLPPGLVAVVARAMARSPVDRFESASDMRKALLDAARAHVRQRADEVPVASHGSLSPGDERSDLQLALVDHRSDPSDVAELPTVGLPRPASRRGLWVGAGVAATLALLATVAVLAWSRSIDRSRVVQLPPAPVGSSPLTAAPSAPEVSAPSSGAVGPSGESPAPPTSGAVEAAPVVAPPAHPALRTPRGPARRRADLVRDPGF